MSPRGPSLLLEVASLPTKVGESEADPEPSSEVLGEPTDTSSSRKKVSGGGEVLPPGEGLGSFTLTGERGGGKLGGGLNS